ncbi:putative Ig domain-containing protein [Agromyces silvae]|uniref:putative Ig domain-containing protein n=1 Tax=Agromyces silvae TaxID=3388266 RepID=UPI00280C36ED|nr:putative Ig domain-containing protein [Agromyces protaetiae]
MGSKRTGRLLAALGCAAIVSLVAPVAAYAAEAVPTESVATVEPADTAASDQPAESAEASATAEAAEPPTAEAETTSAAFSEVPGATAGVPYRHQLVFTGSATTFVAEHLPDWLSMDSSGLLTGTPTVANADGSFKVATVDRSTMRLVEQWMPIIVAEPVPVFTGELPPVRQNEPYSYQVQAAAAGDPSLTFTASGLPAGFSITPGGLITSVPLAKPGSYPVTITATTNQVSPVSSSVTWTLIVTEPEKPVITNSFPPAQQNREFSHQVEFTTPPDTTVTIAATGLPKGFSIKPSGLITGKPDMRPGTYPVTVEAMALSKIPGRGPVFSSILWTLIVAEPEKPVITGTLPAARQNVAFSHQVQATAPADTSLTFTASGLPEGYALTPEGLITGKPDTKPGSYPITITATTVPNLPDRVPVSASVIWTLIVAEPEKPVITGTLPAASADEQYFHEVQATAPADTSLTFTASGLPHGYSIAPNGIITGPHDAKPGSYPVTITATAQPLLPGRVPVSSSVTWTLVVTEPERPVLAELVLPAAVHDTPYSYQVAAKAPASRPYLTFTASGLPRGFSMTPDGLISANANAARPGKYPVTIGVTADVSGRPSVEGKPVTVILEVRDFWWDELGRYHRIVNDSDYNDLNDERVVSGDCPAAMFLDVRSGTDGRAVGQGFIVKTDSWTTAFSRTGVLRYKAHPDGRAASGMDLRVTATGNPGVYVEMVCTGDPAYAWKG